MRCHKLCIVTNTAHLWIHALCIAEYRFAYVPPRVVLFTTRAFSHTSPIEKNGLRRKIEKMKNENGGK